jgi:hypothetical protein
MELGTMKFIPSFIRSPRPSQDAGAAVRISAGSRVRTMLGQLRAEPAMD